MPRKPAPSQRARTAARAVAARGLSFAAAAAEYDISRQAVHRAWHAMYPEAPARPVGRPPAESPRSHTIAIRLADGGRARLRVDEAELEAFTAAAPDGKVSTWLRGLLERRPTPADAEPSAHLRKLARRAAGMPEE